MTDGTARLPELVGGEPPAVDLLDAGTRVGDWVLAAPIASGGFGTVYQAAHAVDGRAAAVKVLHAVLVEDREAMLRFRREVEAVGRVVHPGVVAILGQGELPDGRPWFAMELLEGIDLDASLAQRGRLAVVDALAVLEPLCDALAVAHEKGIVHRDVKASNVFLAAGGRVVLLDFGIAKLLDGGAAGMSRSQAVGTPACMAPEQIAGRPVDARTDVYALGALLYRLVTGEHPFAGESATMMSWLHLHARRPRPSRLVTLPPALDELVIKAMSTDPRARPAGPRAFLEELRRAVAAPGSEPAARRALAVGVHVEAHAPAALLGDPDDRLLADLEAIVPAAVGELGARGLLVVAETGDSALLTRVLPVDPEAAAGVRAEALAAAEAATRVLAERPTRDGRVVVTLAVHVAEVTAAGDRAVGGELLVLPAWAPESPLGGLVATPAGLGRSGDGWVRVV